LKQDKDYGIDDKDVLKKKEKKRKKMYLRLAFTCSYPVPRFKAA